MTLEEERRRIEEDFELLLRLYHAYAGEQDDHLLREAFAFASQAHAEQRRQTGELYITHPLTVATILTELEADESTLIAALLHDTVEDTGKTLEEVEQVFGKEVAVLVDGVTKLEKMSYSSKEEVQAENFRKMFLAMARDIRVVLVKLADRLHNMRTLKTMRPDKQERIARETLDIYAPLAHRLGIYKWKWELEDLCLRYLDRTAYYELVGAIAQRREERESYLRQIIIDLNKAVAQMKIEAEIEGRPKHFYSIYRKMQKKHKTLDEIYDLFACRMIVETVADCYAVLGLVHEMYRPMPGRFKDYIAMPKPNRYQSLHTTVLGPGGVPFEIQIRTFEMHRIAEFGIAAHYRYKAGKTGAMNKKEEAFDDKLSWLRQLLDWQKDMNASEYMESLKTGLLEEEVFVFTPAGQLISLPSGATPIDFAYNIHSGIGNHMYGARVNGKIAPLNTELQNGDIVEILTSEKIQGPSRDWLSLVKSSSARTKIRQWFKKEMKEENIQQGKEIFERELKKTGFTPAQLLQPAFVHSMLDKNNFPSMEALYAAIGYGGISVAKAVPRLRDEYIRSLKPEEREKLGYRVNKNGQVIYEPNKPPLPTQPSKQARRRAANSHGVIVQGLDNALVHLSQCCTPMVGDPIIGYISRGRGVTVHRKDCPNIRKLLSNASLNEMEAERASRLIECTWVDEEQGTAFQVKIRIVARDRSHLLSDISNAIGEEKVAILGGSMDSVRDVMANLTFTLEVKNTEQYNKVLGRIKAVKDVMDAHRI